MTARGNRPLLAVLGAALATVVLSGSVVDTSARLADGATAASRFDALPTLWWASGVDDAGQHGDGSVGPDTSTAARVSWRDGLPVPRDARFEHLAVGDGSACGIAAGRAYCWGDNSHGQLGDGSGAGSSDPVAVATSPDGGSALPADAAVTDLTVGDGAACAVADGVVYCWGDNSAGRLGDGTSASSPVPVAVATAGVGGSAMPSGVATHVVTGGGGVGSTTAFTCAIADAKAYCWGSRENGRLGDGTRGEVPSLVPLAVDASWAESTPVTDLAIGAQAACVVAGGNAYCWGSSLHGTLGNGVSHELADFTVPSPVEVTPMSSLPGSADVTSVAVGATSACAVHDGDVHCWGTNIGGQLGADLASDTEPDTAVVHLPTRVARVGTGASELPTDATVRDLAVGGRVTGADSWCVAADRPGELRRAYCWGDGGAGQLGRADGADQQVPLVVFTHPFSQLPEGIDVDVAGGEGLMMFLAAP